MKRSDLRLGNQQIVARYIGQRLIWQKANFFKTTLVYNVSGYNDFFAFVSQQDPNRTYPDYSKTITVRDIKKIVVKGETYRGQKTELTFYRDEISSLALKKGQGTYQYEVRLIDDPIVLESFNSEIQANRPNEVEVHFVDGVSAKNRY